MLGFGVPAAGRSATVRSDSSKIRRARRRSIGGLSEFDCLGAKFNSVVRSRVRASPEGTRPVEWSDRWERPAPGLHPRAACGSTIKRRREFVAFRAAHKSNAGGAPIDRDRVSDTV